VGDFNVKRHFEEPCLLIETMGSEGTNVSGFVDTWKVLQDEAEDSGFTFSSWDRDIRYDRIYSRNFEPLDFSISGFSNSKNEFISDHCFISAEFKIN
jgi:hypothetical protein